MIQWNIFFILLSFYLLAEHIRGRILNYFDSELAETCDYVIVGAGTAGCVLVSRLSEMEQMRVCVFEAGGTDTRHRLSPLVETPWIHQGLQDLPVFWNFSFVQQKFVNKQNLIGGKILGGSSSVNGMNYIRLGQAEYDLWEQLGATGWNQSSATKYFQKLENNCEDDVEEGPENKCGKFPISQDAGSVQDAEFIHNFDIACAEFGVPKIDCKGTNSLGYCSPYKSYRHGRRSSTSSAYLHPVIEKPNVFVFVNANVHKIVIDPSSKSALGILVKVKGQIHHVQAKKEVILSAGVIQSPKLLQLSGIGPSQALQRLKIPVIRDLPVGSNLKDHVAIDLNLQSVYTNKDLSQTVKLIDGLKEYVTGRTGPCSVSSTARMWFFKTDNSPNNNIPDIQVSFSSRRRFYKKVGVGVNHISMSLAHPKSTGRITLSSPDPEDDPIIDYQFLSHPDDLKTFTKGVKHLFKLLKTPQFKKAKTTVLTNKICEGMSPESDEQISCWIKHLSRTFIHMTSTCKMGGEDDPTTVVDPELRVKGIKNLRVVDASVMPEVTSGNTMATVIMIAEKASDQIKADNENIVK